MARAEVTGRRIGVPKKRRKIPRPKTSTDERDAWSLQEFCARHSISRSTFYNLRKFGQGPHETRVGRKIVITRADAAAWLKEAGETIGLKTQKQEQRSA